MDEKKKAIQRSSEWNKKHLIAFTFRFNKDAHKDIIECLKSQGNKTQYLVDLIRKDIATPKEAKQPPLLVRDLASMMNANDCIFLIFDDDSEMCVDLDFVKQDTRIVDSYDKTDNYWRIKVRYR